MIKCTENHTFENWARTIKFKPKRFCEPTTEQDVVDIVRAARTAGTHVRIQGAERSHAWLQFTVSGDTRVTLVDVDRALLADLLAKLYEVPVGLRLLVLVTR